MKEKMKRSLKMKSGKTEMKKKWAEPRTKLNGPKGLCGEISSLF